MVLAPPSVKPRVGSYVWISNVPPANAPEWLIALAVERQGRNGERVPNEELAADDDRLVAAGVAVILNEDLGWESWNRIAMAIYGATDGSDAGFAAFDSFSRKSTKYDARNTRAKWDALHSCPPDRIGAGTLFYHASEADPGWRDALDDEIAANIDTAGRDPAVHAKIMAEFDAADAIGGNPANLAAAIPENPAAIPENPAIAADEVTPEMIKEDAGRGTGGTGSGTTGAPPKDERPAAEPAPAQKTWRDVLPFVDMSGWDDVPVPEQEWAVAERIPLRSAFLFSGEGAAGKSLTALQLCAATALVRQWLGTVPMPGPAVFVDAEDPVGVIHRRLADILRHHGAKFADLRDRLHVMSLVGRDAVLATFGRKTRRIEPTVLYARLMEMAGDLKPKMVAIASSADVFAGSEIDRTQVQQFVGMLTRLAMRASGSVVLISHPSLTGIASDSGLSGSTQWHNSVRARAVLKGVKPANGEPQDTDLRVMEFRKNNYGRVSESVVLRYQGGVFVPVVGTSAEQAERHHRAEEVYLRVLKKLTDQNQDLGTSRTAQNYAPAKISADPSATGFSRADMEAAQQRLIDQHRIHIATEGAPSRERKRVRLGPGPDPADEPM
jgi:RecA-family ATPase